MNIFVTGGTGLIARYTIKKLYDQGQYQICAIVSPERKSFAEELYNDLDGIQIINTDSFFCDAFLSEMLPGSYVVHTAFSRKNVGVEIAKSLSYLRSSGFLYSFILCFPSKV